MQVETLCKPDSHQLPHPVSTIFSVFYTQSHPELLLDPQRNKVSLFLPPSVAFHHSITPSAPGLPLPPMIPTQPPHQTCMHPTTQDKSLFSLCFLSPAPVSSTSTGNYFLDIFIWISQKHLRSKSLKISFHVFFSGPDNSKVGMNAQLEGDELPSLGAAHCPPLLPPLPSIPTASIYPRWRV